MSRLSTRLFAGCLLASLALLPTRDAGANGRFPATVNVEFQPGDTDFFLLPSTFGLLLSENGGSSFQWICEETVGYGGTYDPDYAITADGNVYATTFEGLRFSDDGACSFQKTKFFGDPTGGNNPVELEGIWVGEIEVASDGKIWATTSTANQSNDVYVSTDGVNFNSANNWDEVAWWRTLRVAPSDPNRLYTSAYVIAEIDSQSGETLVPAKALLRRTTNGGQSWDELGVSDFTFGSQPNLFLEGVSPADPDVVYARVLGVREPTGDDLYRSADGGQSWTKVLEMHGTISAFTVRSDGSVVVGTATPCAEDFDGIAGDASVPDKGCVRVSTTGEAGTFTTPALEPKMGCVGERPADGALFGCGGNWEPDNFAFGLSEDGGDSWSSLLTFAEIEGPKSCPSETIQAQCAINNWPTVCVMLGICEAPDAGAFDGDGGVNVDGDAGTDGDDGGKGSCLGCSSSGEGGLSMALGFLMLLGLGFRRRWSVLAPSRRPSKRP